MKYSTLLLHVIDISDKDWQQQYHTVKKTILELEADNIPVLEVYNKIDLLDSIEYEAIKTKLLERNNNIIFVNATNKSSTVELMDEIKKIINNKKIQNNN